MSELTTSQREAWDSSATDYATFASHSRIYKDTAEALVRLAEIKAGMTIVDLACGSGLVTESILRRRGGNKVTIMATDFSEQMLAAARERIPSARVTFRCEAAEHLSRVVEGHVDRVLCNAAFWQFDREAALAQIARVLEPSGRCLLTLPDWSGLINDLDVQYNTHKLLWMICEEMLIRGHKIRKPAPRPPVAGPATPPQPDAFPLSTDGLRVEKIEHIAVKATARDHFEFLQIPVMVKRFSETSGVSDAELRDIVTVVRNQLEWVDVRIPPQIWKVVVLEKTSS